MRYAIRLIGIFLISGNFFPSTARAQPYPNKPVRLIVAAAPGGGIDILGRLVAQRLSEKLGQPFIVDNKGGAGGAIAADFVSKSPRDGYTLLVNNEQMVATPSLTARSVYDPIKDFVPVGLLGRQPSVIAVNANVPASNLKELIELARKSPKKYSFASCGQGTPVHIAGEMLKLAAKVEIVHVPYRGCTPAMTDTVSGQVPILLTTLGNALPFEKSGNIRILAVATLKRLPEYPNIATVAESGFPNFESASWFGVFAPSGTPPDVVAKLNLEITALVNSQDEKLRSMQFVPATATSAEFQSIVRQDFARWKKVVQEAKIDVEQ